MSIATPSRSPIFDAIRQEIEENDVVLYMKGTSNAPMCGFSGFVVHVLNHYKIAYKDVNVLADPDLRQAIKDFTQWPTIPQLYVKGEFIGGADIIREMHQSGELEALFKEHQLVA